MGINVLAEYFNGAPTGPKGGTISPHSTLETPAMLLEVEVFLTTKSRKMGDGRAD